MIGFWGPFEIVSVKEEADSEQRSHFHSTLRPFLVNIAHALPSHDAAKVTITHVLCLSSLSAECAKQGLRDRQLLRDPAEPRAAQRERRTLTCGLRKTYLPPV